jgi:hypothetical protein
MWVRGVMRGVRNVALMRGTCVGSCERRIGRGARIIWGVYLWHVVGGGGGIIGKANCMGFKERERGREGGTVYRDERVQ